MSIQQQQQHYQDESTSEGKSSDNQQQQQHPSKTRVSIIEEEDEELAEGQQWGTKDSKDLEEAVDNNVLSSINIVKIPTDGGTKVDNSTSQKNLLHEQFTTSSLVEQHQQQDKSEKVYDCQCLDDSSTNRQKQQQQQEPLAPQIFQPEPQRRRTVEQMQLPDDNLSQKQKHQQLPRQQQYNSVTSFKSRDCFEDIELFLNNLNKKLAGPAQQTDCCISEDERQLLFDLISEYKVCKQFTDKASKLKGKQSITTSATSGVNKSSTRKICSQPEYNSNIFNPFRKPYYDLKLKPKKTADTNNMKYDYRRDAANNPATSSTKNSAKNASDLKKTYLFLYNVTLFILFLMVSMILTIKLISGTIDDDTVRGATTIIKLLTYTQLMESIHPILGLVPGGPMMPFLQVIGRLIVNHFLSEPTIRINSAPYAHYLFIVWSCIEIFRYSL